MYRIPPHKVDIGLHLRIEGILSCIEGKLHFVDTSHNCSCISCKCKLEYQNNSHLSTLKLKKMCKLLLRLHTLYTIPHCSNSLQYILCIQFMMNIARTKPRILHIWINWNCKSSLFHSFLNCRFDLLWKCIACMMADRDSSFQAPRLSGRC